jgi:HSP20 family protein
MPSQDVDLSIESNRVTLRGERRVERPGDASAHRLERPSGSFQRTVELPGDVDADKAEATCRHGVLMLRIPKAPQHQRRRITVSG